MSGPARETFVVPARSDLVSVHELHEELKKNISRCRRRKPSRCAAQGHPLATQQANRRNLCACPWLTRLTQALEAAHAFHTTRSPSEEDNGACAVLAQALADGSDEAEEALEVRGRVV